MIIIKVLSGNASIQSLHVALSVHLNTDLCESITLFGNDFILSLFSIRKEVTIIKRNSMTLNTNLGQCTISFRYWSLELDSHAITIGNYNWVINSNLPLQCYNWDSIVEVLRQLPELIYVQKWEHIYLEHMRALVRLKP